MKKRITLPIQIGSLLLIGLIMAIGTYLFLARHNERIIRDRLGKLALDVSTLVKERISNYEYGLRGARGLIIGASNERLSRGMSSAFPVGSMRSARPNSKPRSKRILRQGLKT
ncbi:MAG TPA: hypothetical protein VMV44_02745 [Rectinemataceae bacterium]|nr:hypothetical protein [Rectinemataceae bacterium]